MPIERMSLSPLEFAAMKCLLRNAAGIRAPSGPNISHLAVGVRIMPEIIVQFVANHVEFAPDELDDFRRKFCALVDESSEPVRMDLTRSELDAISMAVTAVQGMPAHPAYVPLIREGDIPGIASLSLREGALAMAQSIVSDEEHASWEPKVAWVLAYMKVQTPTSIGYFVERMTAEEDFA